HGPVAPVQPACRGGRALALARQPTCAHRALAAGGVPAEDDAVARRDVLDARAHGFDRAGTLVSEQDRKRMTPAVLLGDVQIGVTDAARLDANGDLAGLRLVDDDLLERDRARGGQDDAAIHEESSSAIERAPISASVRSVSAASCSINAATPASPPTASA